MKIGEGDGTVSLLSLGAMCVEGWKRPNWNPAGIEVKTIEASLQCSELHSVPPSSCLLRKLPHRPDALDPRGGATTSDHIDILGSTGLNEIVLKVAAGRGDEIGTSCYVFLLLANEHSTCRYKTEDSFVSPIREYVKKMQWD